MRTLYNILFLIGFVLASPYYFWRMRRRGNWRAGFVQRLGRYDTKLKQAITNRHVLWMHAVSVGEVNLCTQLIRALEPRLPNLKIVVSTTTTTGMAELNRRLPSHITRIYYPIDRKLYVARALGTIKPKAVVLVEAEIWPNFLWRARNQGCRFFWSMPGSPRVPTDGINGSVSFSVRCSGVSPEWAPRMKPMPRACASWAADRSCPCGGQSQIRCGAPRGTPVSGCAGDAEAIGGNKDGPVLVAGSTHAGEEVLLAEQCRRLRQRFPNLS